MRSYLLVLVLFTAGTALATDVPGTSDIARDEKVAAKLRAAERWLDGYLKYRLVPGASAAIVHDQELIWAGGVGYANLATKYPATARTRYGICSISKLFTAIAVMQLRDEGKVDLDRRLGEYLRWLDLKDSAAAEPVTARNVLLHVSGLPREAGLSEGLSFWSEMDFPDSAVLHRAFKGAALSYAPYTQRQYSNLGFALLGEVVENVSGQSYGAYVRQHILEPLRLNGTTTDLVSEGHGTTFAVGYGPHDETGRRQPIPFYQGEAMAPSMGFVSTAEDLARFASWQFRLLQTGRNEVLKTATLREMQRIQWMEPDWRSAAGLGFSARRHADKVFIGHGGHCPGYKSVIALAPAERLAIIVLINSSNLVSPPAIANQLYDLIANDIKAAAEAPRASQATAAPLDSDLARYEGLYAGIGYSSALYFTAAGRDELLGVEVLKDDPAANLLKLKHERDHRFRRVGKNGEAGEEWRFEVGAAGATRVWNDGGYFIRQ